MVRPANSSYDVELEVRILTYNHEGYITKCIDSFMEQKTDFDFSIMIYDDCSYDRTIDIVKKTYGSIIGIHRNNKNLGIGLNDYMAKVSCRAKYLMVYAGDDWLLGADNLQDMYEFLEKNKEYVAVGGRVVQYDENEVFQFATNEELNCYTFSSFVSGQAFNIDPLMVRNIFRTELYSTICKKNPQSNEPQEWFYILLFGWGGVLQKNVRAYRCIKKHGLTNYNSMYSPLDDFINYYRALVVIEEEMNLKNIFRFRKIIREYNVFRYSLHDAVRNHRLKSIIVLFRFLGVIKAFELCLYSVVLYLNHGHFSERMTKHAKDRCMRILKRNGFSIKQIKDLYVSYKIYVSTTR